MPTTHQQNRDVPIHLIESCARPFKTDIQTLYTSVYKSNDTSATTFVVDGSPTEDPVSIAIEHTPSLPRLLKSCLAKGSLLIDLGKKHVYRGDEETDDPDSHRLILDVFETVAHMPRNRFSAHHNSTVSIILAGGKGTRMQSEDTPKVCFPVADVPAVLRLIDQLEKAGVHRHIVVVGDKGRSVIDAVSSRHDNVHFNIPDISHRNGKRC